MRFPCSIGSAAGLLRIASVSICGFLLGCGRSSVGEIETISRVPVWVLTVDDLNERVRRSPQEVGVETAGQRVVGVLTQTPVACDTRFPVTCKPGAATRYRFRSSWEPGSREMSAVLSNLDGPLEIGQTYVLYGTVNVAPDVPERWELRAVVLARVR